MMDELSALVAAQNITPDELVVSAVLADYVFYCGRCAKGAVVVRHGLADGRMKIVSRDTYLATYAMSSRSSCVNCGTRVGRYGETLAPTMRQIT